MNPPFHNLWSHKLFDRLEDDLAIASHHCDGLIDVPGMASAYINHGVLLATRTNQLPSEDMCSFLRTLIKAIENKDEFLPCLTLPDWSEHG